jgi:hypothetical protein
MSLIQDIEPRIFSLPERDRAELASRLLLSLKPELEDDDEGVREALQRESSARNDSTAWLTMEQFEAGIVTLRKK